MNSAIVVRGLVCFTMVVAILLALNGCDRPTASAVTQAAPKETPFKMTASVQELMQALVDPSADGVWDSVGTTLTQKGAEEHQPHTDDEWKQVRLRAVALIEATNLLMMDGRRLVPRGGKIADDGSEGVLTTEEAERKLQAEHPAFVQFALSLNDVGAQMLQAIDERKPAKMVEVGETMDEVCESCHMKFWYPNQPTWTVKQGSAKASQ